MYVLDATCLRFKSEKIKVAFFEQNPSIHLKEKAARS
jgi:hypothetical protein